MKVSKDIDDKFKYFDNETYDREVVDNYLQVSLYDDSPEFKPIKKKLHYDKEIVETKDYYYTCNRGRCYNQLVHIHHKQVHNKYYHPSICIRFINWLFCRN